MQYIRDSVQYQICSFLKRVISTTTKRQEQQQQTRQTRKTRSTNCSPGRLPKESTLNNNKQTCKSNNNKQDKQAKPQAQAADQVGHPRRVISAGSIVLIHCPIGLHHPLDAISCKWSSPDITFIPDSTQFRKSSGSPKYRVLPNIPGKP